MKYKIVLPIVSTLLISLACQFTGQPPADESEVPKQSPEAISQPTATIVPTEAPTHVVSSINLESEIIDDFAVPMVLVPEGEFLMGSDNGSDDEKPVHQVHLDAFYMDIYEVTNARYQACVDAGGCTPPQEKISSSRSSYYGNSEFDDYPVVYIDWNQANTYCEWRGGNLPTEAQWEKATRGTDGRTYPWGEGIDTTFANYALFVGDTTKVGSYESGKSSYGIYDLVGNVMEWVADWYSETYYQNSPSENPLGPDSNQYRVLRGGSWHFSGYLVRSAYRYQGDPTGAANVYIGFRCAKDENP